MGHLLALGLTAKAPRILMYHRFSKQPAWHRISQEVFEEQLKYLKANFNIVRLTDLARILRDGHAPPRNTAVLTIDDGYLDFSQIAAPLLVKYEIPATVFIVSDFADQKIWLWHDAIHYLTTHAPAGACKIEFNRKAVEFKLTSPDDRNRMWLELADRVLTESGACKWKLINECQEQLGVELPPIPTDAYRSMGWNELTNLSPLIDIGSHTRNHPILSTLHDPKELACEVGGSKRHIEKNIGKPVTTFCYPNGQVADYNNLTVNEVKHSGYECAVVAYGGLMTSTNTNLFELPRIPAQQTLGMFKNTASGLSFLKKKYTRQRSQLSISSS